MDGSTSSQPREINHSKNFRRVHCAATLQAVYVCMSIYNPISGCVWGGGHIDPWSSWLFVCQRKLNWKFQLSILKNSQDNQIFPIELRANWTGRTDIKINHRLASLQWTMGVERFLWFKNMFKGNHPFFFRFLDAEVTESGILEDSAERALIEAQKVNISFFLSLHAFKFC